ncbi:DUF2239 family protein [Chondromyces crocatus]|uniref:DUF2239 family protein n=1 Tax=Chondromyces crocatus TaxID=52 RepID=UPI001FDED38D|nr:DUF2239 family protein [Chondromyces crocatus]
MTYTAFVGTRCLVSGGLREVLLRTKALLDEGSDEVVLLFDDRTGRQVDFNFQGTPEEVVARATPAAPRTGPGRPKLGVVSREVSLLPRHWAWLEQQPQGISAALRRLVEEASKRDPGKEQARLAREAASQFLTTMAGNLPGYEEATRALFAEDAGRFAEQIRAWPEDVREHAARLAKPSFRQDEAAP